MVKKQKNSDVVLPVADQNNDTTRDKLRMQKISHKFFSSNLRKSGLCLIFFNDLMSR